VIVTKSAADTDVPPLVTATMAASLPPGPPATVGRFSRTIRGAMPTDETLPVRVRFVSAGDELRAGTVRHRG